MANIGALSVSLGLDAAEYTRGLTQAERAAYEFGERIGTGIRGAATAAATALAALGVSAGSAVAGFNSLIEGAAKFSDLADKTGASAEALASFAVAAGTSGVSMDKVASATNTLTKNLVGVNDESKAAGAALKALGIPLQEFKALKPEEQIERLSKTLGGFQDGAAKSAVAMALFGKAGADVIPFLKTLDEQGGRNVILTQQMIDQADEYADRQAKAKAELQLYAQALAVQAIPAVTAFTGALTDTIKELLGVGNGANDLKNNTAVADFAENAVRVLAFIIDAGDGVVRTFQTIGTAIGGAAAGVGALVSGDFKGAVNIASEAAADIDKILSRETFSSKLDKRIAEGKKALASSGGTETRRALSFNGRTRSGGGSKDDPTKKLLDNQLKELQRASKQEQDLLQSRNKMLDLYYGENLVSIEDYYAARLANQEEATSKEIALIDQQVAALEKYKASAKKDTDRADAQGKINALLDEETKLQRAAGQSAIEESFKKAKAVQQYKDALDGVRASLMEISGDSGGAASLRVELQYRDLLAKAVAQNDTAGQKLIETLKQQTVAQAKYNAEATSASQITARLQIDEDRIGLSRQLGATGELESLAQLGAARKAAVAQMQSVVEAQEAIARASGNPALVLQAEQARLALDSLKASADPLADKFNNLFADSASSAFMDFVNGTKTAKQAFTSFLSSVTNELTSLIAKDLFKQAFSGGTGSSGGGFNFGAVLSSFFGGGKAIGGPVMPNTLYEVAENRPELLDVNGKKLLLMGNQRGSIDPNPDFGSDAGGFNQHIQFVMSERADRSTQSQIAARVRRETQAAAVRFA